MPIEVAVQANPADAGWLRTAEEVEAAGFAALYVSDHPGTAASPFVALAAAAAVTTWIPLGTCVLNAGLWEPLQLASAVATLDAISGGRALLGVGAGHTPQEWAWTGRPFPPAAKRVSRMIELVESSQALLDGGPVEHRGHHFVLGAARLERPRPHQPRVPLLIGGNGPRVLSFAARHADIVSITGLARTLSDGHHHAVDWSAAALHRTVQTISDAAGSAGRRPLIEALVQVVEITDDAERTARFLAHQISGAAPGDLLDAPYAWIGTVAEILSKLERLKRLGVDRYVIREASMPATGLIRASVA
jgi:probable F420-dependent oxidoreductase